MEGHLNGKVILHHGDSRDVLKSLEDCSIDSVVTDPPYALVSIGKRLGKPGSSPASLYARASAGFMGQSWDTGETAFAAEFWAEVLRVLKPGGHVVAFSGTRTYHRMVVAIEDAGFEIRDQLAWVYGCLSGDTEILTESGWRLGVDVNIGDTVAAWDSTTGGISLEIVEDMTIAPWCGPLVRFVNDDTDQLVTPNHRVYFRERERVQVDGIRTSSWSEFRVRAASEFNRWNYIQLPLAGIHDGPGIGGEDYAALLGWVFTEGGFDSAPSTGVRIYQSGSANPDKVAEIDALMRRTVQTHSRYERSREYSRGSTVRMVEETCWFFTGEWAKKIRADLPGKHPTWSLLWRMTEKEKRSFYRAAMLGDGSGYSFYQKDVADLEWFQSLAATIGMRGKIAVRQAPRDGGSVCITSRSTTELQSRHLKTDKHDYCGNVWCVKVRTGAFVARRNGKIFITGNSGFPKSHDIAKAIDKSAGHWRGRAGEVIDRSVGQAAKGTEYDRSDKGEPVTAAAAAWDGWGTALKPAWEPIVLARKPLAGTVAANVLEYGTGGLNIDGCRVEGVKPAVQNVAFEAWRQAEGRTDRQVPPQTYDAAQGRWPANIIHDGSDEVVAMFPDSAGQSGDILGTEPSMPLCGNVYGHGLGRISVPSRRDGGSASRFFYSSKADAHDRIGSKHPTIKPIDLMQWLCRLVTPPGGIVLDPFAGSGTTGEAAWREGFRAILIEREATYCDDIRRRLRLAENPAERTAVAKAKGVTAADHGPLFGGAPPPRGQRGTGRRINGYFDGRTKDRSSRIEGVDE